MKRPLLSVLIVLTFSLSAFSQTNIDAGPLNEVFRQTNLRVAATRLYDPWEITYGPDDSLWITEAKAYKVDKVSPVNGGMRTVLDISQGSAFTPAIFKAQFNIATNNPQGGLMGLAIHPEFATNPAKKFVYLAYIYSYTGALADSQGVVYVSRIVRFTYNGSQLVSPVSLCDTLPGSSDHNSGRMIIAPVGGVNYLFYAMGDMGAGQFGNKYRMNKAQMPGSYEGKILRFNLEPDGDAGTLDQWIPNGNPYNAALGVQSAVWSIGIRNNQGFAYATINGTGKLYGASHGPYTDDEINIIDSAKNYGHPIIEGFSADNNYNNSRAGSKPRGGLPGTYSQLPLIVNETTNATTIGSKYRDPLYSFYAPSQATVNNIYLTEPSNIGWPSEAPSGIDIYTNSMIPGWKNSLLLGSLKGGRILRLNLDANGTNTAPYGNTDATSRDTNTLFRSVNRFRDLAISADGKTIFTVIDSSSTTSGPTTGSPIISACRGCVQKYTFLGYNANGTTPFASTIPTTINIAAGTPGACENANKVVINAANNNTSIWVPITDNNGNVVAEIYANGQDLDTVTTSFYKNAGTVREDGGARLYMDRNITITPQIQPGSAVRLRLYITNAEFTSLSTALNSASQPSGVATISNLGIFKNSNNACVTSLTGNAAAVTTISKVAHGTLGYVLQTNTLTSFSTFYFANVANSTLPVNLLSFTGRLSNNTTVLNWITSSEVNTANFEIERSTDGSSYEKIKTVAASGNSTRETNYSYTDNDVAALSSAVIYYRLKMMDRDGNYAYSNIITISLADITGKVTIFPNPVADEAKITMAASVDGKAQWKIIDNAGHTVQQGSSLLKKGRNNMGINVNKLSAGIYYLSVSGAGIDQKVKLQKL
jgi:PQQ-dependent dehydrogenase (s-GDH family)